MAGFFPRLALFILWVARPTRIDAAIDTILLPLLGIIFLPFATLMYVLLYTPGRGRSGWDWFWVVIAALLDIGHWGAGVTQRNPRGRPARRSAPGRERPRSPRACPCPHGQDHPSIRTSVRLASALPDVRQSGSSSSAEQDGPNSSRPSAVRGGCSPGSWSLGADAATQDARWAAVHPLWVMPVPPHVGRLAGGGLSGGLCEPGGST